MPVGVGRGSEEALAVIVRMAAGRGAPLGRWEDDFSVEGDSPTRFPCRGMKASYASLTSPQALREVAWACVVPVSETGLCEGLRAVRREERPATVEADLRREEASARNPVLEAMVPHVAGFRPECLGVRLVSVSGMRCEKDPRGSIAHLFPLADDVIVTQARIFRRAAADDPAASVRARGRDAWIRHDPAGAIRLARHLAGPGDLILGTGFPLLVGEAEAILLGDRLSPVRG